MPGRILPLVNGQIYHIFNRSINRKPIFVTRRENLRAIETLSFYRFHKPPVRLSLFLLWNSSRKSELVTKLTQKRKVLITILSYCLMPNHFHLLLRQEIDNGISNYLSQIQNSYTKYFNTKFKETGHLFQGRFKAIRIETDEQLIHVSRYIHLNPYTSYIVKEISELLEYEWSSLPEYLDKRGYLCEVEDVMSNFKDINSYKQFIIDQAEYQRTLGTIRHLLLEEQ